MPSEPTITKPRLEVQRPIDLRELVAELKLAIARLDADIARAEVRRLEEQLAWERAWRRRGLLGRLF
ncbi:MAG TPA: hypothetical protein VFU94_13965 [Conexibacter sp.]|nr:hypothetical protein [Conexibacter sp.]